MTNIEAFKSLILKLTIELSNINKDVYSKTIQECLNQVGMFLDVDRIYLFKYTNKTELIELVSQWLYKDVESIEEHLLEINPKYLKDIWMTPHIKGHTVIYEDVTRLDKHNPLLKVLYEQSVKSNITIPLMTDSKCLGLIGFDDVRRMRSFSDKELGLLNIFVNSLTNALLKEERQTEIVDLKKQVNQAGIEKNHFLSRMSHEFRTPLHGIKNALYLLELTGLSNEQKEYFNIASYSVESLSSMIDDILSVSSIQAEERNAPKEIFDLENELSSIILIQQIEAHQKGLEITFNFDYSIKNLFKGDVKKIKQIIQHLLNNAIKYTQEGYISLGVNKSNETKTYMDLEFNVIDSGIGMSKDSQDKIFDRFFQVDSNDTRKYKGAGLGLSIVKKLVDYLGGSFTVKSEIDKGSLFSIKLRIDKHDTYDFSLAKNKKVLIVDDNLASKKVSEMFTSMDMKVDTLKNANLTYDYIVFSKNKSLNFLETYKKDFGTKETLIIFNNQKFETKQNQIDILINQMMSRKTVYQRIISKSNDQTGHITDNYMSTLSGYALVVDDNRLNRIVLENLLRKQGIKSKLVDSGYKAIEAVKKERFDIVLMDIQMPDMDGMKTSNKIRKLGPQYKDLPIIAVTANIYLNDYDILKKAQMDDVLYKPINIDQLERKLRKYILNETSIFIPNTQKVFDQSDYEYRFEGSYEIALDVVKTYITTYEKDLNKIGNAIKNKDKIEIKEALHYFKGSCSYLSGMRATWMLTLMMDLNEKEENENLLKAYEILQFEVLQLVKALKSYIKRELRT